ncbi:MAG TPA: hypothetical protein VL330_15430 [Actinomycetes bacterium]|nr:hypothetical protein [Actinomycetes bacterium]
MTASHDVAVVHLRRLPGLAWESLVVGAANPRSRRRRRLTP